MHSLSERLRPALRWETGLAVVVTSLGLSWLGDGLSDLLSPDRRK